MLEIKKQKQFILLIMVLSIFRISAQRKPYNIEADVYQREIKLSWNSDSYAVKWEIIVDNQAPLIASTNSYILENLKPNTRYAIKIRAFKNNVFSEFTTVSNSYNKTNAILSSEQDISRIPYLRTITGRRNRYGVIKKDYIKLYYNDLWGEDAVINYFIDGVPIFPDGSKLKFTKSGEQNLTIIIKETPQRVWELTYKLDIRF